MCCSTVLPFSFEAPKYYTGSINYIYFSARAVTWRNLFLSILKIKKRKEQKQKNPNCVSFIPSCIDEYVGYLQLLTSVKNVFVGGTHGKPLGSVYDFACVGMHFPYCSTNLHINKQCTAVNNSNNLMLAILGLGDYALVVSCAFP